jgi:hypothetical protein
MEIAFQQGLSAASDKPVFDFGMRRMKTKSILKRLLLAAAACAAMSLASVGQAGLLGSTNLYGDAVTISYNGAQTGTTAGAFEGATFNGGLIPPFWCIDLLDHVPYPPWVLPDYSAAPFQSPPLTFTSAEVSNLETLFSNQYSGTLFTSTDNAAAFQLAIWDILFDNDGNLSTYGASGFGVVSGSIAPGVVTLAQGWITAAETGPQNPYPLIQLTNSSVPPYQNFTYPGPQGEVPEPAGLALFGAGFIAMMFVTRRRRTDVHLTA